MAILSAFLAENLLPYASAGFPIEQNETTVYCASDLLAGGLDQLAKVRQQRGGR